MKNPNLCISFKTFKMIDNSLDPVDRGFMMSDIVKYVEDGVVDMEFKGYNEPLLAAALWMSLKVELDNSIENYNKFLKNIRKNG